MPKARKPNPVPPEKWAWIRYMLKINGFTFVSLAEKFNYHPNSIKTAKTYAYPAVEKVIAEAIGMTPQTLFPNRYTVNGKSIVRDYPRVQRLSERKKLINGKDLEANRHETEK